MTASELAHFLQSRRARLSPEVAGVVPHGTVRRVLGLKREEVASLAGVSADYYARLEQGRPVRFSPSVLQAVGHALQLDRVDQAHLRDLVSSLEAPMALEQPGRPTVLPAYERIVRGLADRPAFVTDWRHNVLLANPVALALYLDMGSAEARERNFARFVFTHPAARGLFVDWDVTAALVVGSMRRNLAHHPGDPELRGLIAELRPSAGFEDLWGDYTLTELVHSRKLYRHPLAGELWVECDNVRLVGESDQLLTIGSTDAGSSSELAMARLCRLVGPWTVGVSPVSRLAQDIEARADRAPTGPGVQDRMRPHERPESSVGNDVQGDGTPEVGDHRVPWPAWRVSRAST